MHHIYSFLIAATLTLLLPSAVPAATAITGTVAAQQGQSFQVKFVPNETACPKVGDAVDFSLQIQNIKVKAGSGIVARIEGNSVWVEVDPASKSKPRLKATGVIQATGQPDLSPLLKGKYDKFLKTKDRTLLNDLETYARNGNPVAQTLMGIISRDGSGGVAADPDQAFQCFQKAAASGHTDAMVELSHALNLGMGVAKDRNKAVTWSRRAAELGHPEAQYDLGMTLLMDDNVPANDAEGVKWILKSAQQGYVKAQKQLATWYYIGSFVQKDPAESIKWYRKAAEQGDAESQCELAKVYMSGLGVARDPAEGMKWYLKAAEQGYKKAQYLLGQFYRLGYGTPRKPQEALKWYLKAAEQGDMSAMEELGTMYEKGDGIPKNRTEAIRWYRKAAATSNWAFESKEALKRLGAD